MRAHGMSAAVQPSIVVGCRSEAGTITVVCSLIFARRLGARRLDDVDLQKMLQRYLMSGRLGQFVLGRAARVYQDFGVESAGRFHSFYATCWFLVVYTITADCVFVLLHRHDSKLSFQAQNSPFRLKTHLFHKSFPPQSASTHLDCLLGLYWTGLTLLNGFSFQLIFSFLFWVVRQTKLA